MPRPALTLHVLGPMTATVGGSPHALPAAAKARALLAYLAVEGRAAPRDELAALLWPEAAPDKARLSLRGALAQLRAALPDRLATDGDGVALALWPGDAVDARDLEGLAASGAEDEAARAAALLRGPLGEGLDAVESPAFRSWLAARRGAFEELGRAVWMRRAEAASEAGRAAEAVAALERAVALDPLHEPTAAALLLALGRAGRAAEALARFEALRAALADELGAEPSAELLAVRERLLEVRARGAPRAVPTPATPFVGRTAEVAAVLAALARSPGRVTTVVGPGGIGKTRLAIEAATRLGGRFLDGVRFVPLAGLSPGAALAPSVAAALDLQAVGAASVEELVIEALRGQEVLLVLDNFETVADQAPACGRLAEAGPGVRVLATSRQPLGLGGETVVRLGGMGYPDGGGPPEPARHDAVALFVAAARRARDDFDPRRELAAIRAICRAVEGYPLALELAAPWVATLGCGEIAARLASDPTTVPPAAGLPERHASLEAVFEHSWSLLDGPNRLAFARLCVFRGGFDAQAAAEAAGVGAEQVDALVRRSLVQRHGAGRFAVHEVLRHFGAARLDGTPAVAARARDAHARHYLGRLAASSRAHGPDHPEVVARVAGDADNVVAAWRHAVGARDLDAVAPVAADLAGHYYAQGPSEAGIGLADDLEAWRADAAAAGAAAPALTAVAARLVAERGFFALRRDDSARAAADAERALALAGTANDPMGRARAGGEPAVAGDAPEPGIEAARDAAASAALRLRGILRRTAGELDAADGDLAEAEARARRAGDERLAAEAAYHRAGIAAYRGDVAGCIAGTRAVLEAIAGRGFGRLECALHFTLAVLLDRAGDVAGGTVASERCLAIATGSGYRLGEMNAAASVGMLQYRRGDLAGALSHLERSIQLAAELGHGATLRNARLAAAVALADLGRTSEAWYHVERALAQADGAADARGAAQVRLRMAHIHRVRHDLDAARAAAEAALAGFEALGDAAHAAIARAEVGRIARRRGDAAAARTALDAAIADLEALGERTQWLAARLDRARLARAVRRGSRPGAAARRTALATAEEVRDLAAAAGVADLVASADLVLGRLRLDGGDLEAAAAAFERARARFAADGLPHRAVEAAAGLARSHLAAGRAAEARAVAAAHEDALARHRLVGVDDPQEVDDDLRAARAAPA